MSRSFFFSNRGKVMMVLVLTILLGCRFALLSSASSVSETCINKPESAPITQGQNSERIESELITVKPSGFDPSEIRRPLGRFSLRVNNRSEIHDLDLRLDRETGERVHEVRLPRGRLQWMKFLDLPPGKYRLSEVNHPEWVCTITITPR